MDLKRHKEKEHEPTHKKQIEEEMIKNGNKGQECDQCERGVCDETDPKRHKMKEHKPTRKKENKEEDKKTHENEWR